MNVPQHIAIILDGNGRWAKSKGMPRNYGHAQGSKNVERICEEAWRLGIKYLTVYAFSTENWSRPKNEVDALMTLLRNYRKQKCPELVSSVRLPISVWRCSVSRSPIFWTTAGWRPPSPAPRMDIMCLKWRLLLLGLRQFSPNASC